MPNACRKEPGHRLIQKCDKDDKGSGAQCNLCLVNRTTEQRHSETRTQMETQQGEGGGGGGKGRKKKRGGENAGFYGASHLRCSSTFAFGMLFRSPVIHLSLTFADSQRQRTCNETGWLEV